MKKQKTTYLLPSIFNCGVSSNDTTTDRKRRYYCCFKNGFGDGSSSSSSIVSPSVSVVVGRADTRIMMLTIVAICTVLFALQQAAEVATAASVSPNRPTVFDQRNMIQKMNNNNNYNNNKISNLQKQRQIDSSFFFDHIHSLRGGSATTSSSSSSSSSSTVVGISWKNDEKEEEDSSLQQDSFIFLNNLFDNSIITSSTSSITTTTIPSSATTTKDRARSTSFWNMNENEKMNNGSSSSTATTNEQLVNQQQSYNDNDNNNNNNSKNKSFHDGQQQQHINRQLKQQQQQQQQHVVKLPIGSRTWGGLAYNNDARDGGVITEATSSSSLPHSYTRREWKPIDFPNPRIQPNICHLFPFDDGSNFNNNNNNNNPTNDNNNDQDQEQEQSILEESNNTLKRTLFCDPDGILNDGYRENVLLSMENFNFLLPISSSSSDDKDGQKTIVLPLCGDSSNNPLPSLPSSSSSVTTSNEPINKKNKNHHNNSEEKEEDEPLPLDGEPSQFFLKSRRERRRHLFDYDVSIGYDDDYTYDYSSSSSSSIKNDKDIPFHNNDVLFFDSIISSSSTKANSMVDSSSTETEKNTGDWTVVTGNDNEPIEPEAFVPIEVAVAIVSKIDLNSVLRSNSFYAYEDEDDLINEAAQYFARYLHNNWHVGSQTCGQAGILIFLSIGDRVCYISTGSLIESIVPWWRLEYVVSDIKPILRKREYGEALLKAIEDIRYYLNEGPPTIQDRMKDFLKRFGLVIAFACFTFIFALWGEYRDRFRRWQYTERRSKLNDYEIRKAKNLQEEYHCKSCPICLEEFPIVSTTTTTSTTCTDIPSMATAAAAAATAASTSMLQSNKMDANENEDRTTLVEGDIGIPMVGEDDQIVVISSPSSNNDDDSSNTTKHKKLSNNNDPVVPTIGNDGLPLKLLRCGHVFDQTCWKCWVDKGQGNPLKCPVCRQDIGGNSSSKSSSSITNNHSFSSSRRQHSHHHRRPSYATYAPSTGNTSSSSNRRSGRSVTNYNAVDDNNNNNNTSSLLSVSSDSTSSNERERQQQRRQDSSSFVDRRMRRNTFANIFPVRFFPLLGSVSSSHPYLIDGASATPADDLFNTDNSSNTLYHHNNDGTNNNERTSLLIPVDDDNTITFSNNNDEVEYSSSSHS